MPIYEKKRESLYTVTHPAPLVLAKPLIEERATPEAHADYAHPATPYDENRIKVQPLRISP